MNRKCKAMEIKLTKIKYKGKTLELFQVCNERINE